MIQSFHNMTVFTAVLVIAGIIGLNLIYMFWFRTYIRHYFKKTGSPELTLHRMRIFSQYIYLILVMVTSFFMTVIITIQFFNRFRDASSLFSILALVLALFILGLLLMCNQLILHGTMSEIRGTTETRKEGSGKAVRGILLSFIPIILMITALNFIQDGHLGSFFSHGFGEFLTPIVLIICLQFIMPLFIGRSLKAKPMEPSPVRDRLMAFSQEVGIKKVRLYVWPTRKSKTANALVTGFTTKRVFISDYMMDHFSEEEILSVVAHEFGHIKRFHLWIRLGLILFFVSLMSGLGSLFDWLETNWYAIPIWLGISIFGLTMVVYLVFALRFIFRIQERQADDYVLTLGIDYRVYACALLSLARLNHMLTNMKRMDETFQTHPSIARRVNWIVERANGSFEDIKGNDFDTIEKG